VNYSILSKRVDGFEIGASLIEFATVDIVVFLCNGIVGCDAYICRFSRVVQNHQTAERHDRSIAIASG